ncbi:TetR/AcrR family transcriptional regulator [Psychromonas aquatilis]|uniref:TetR/AcrR family transcriptional regulator n=1 Tax=Psychromonas aquatilis TaxID=2005072 RepID=A0ABU9GM18_9GAMM
MSKRTQILNASETVLATYGFYAFSMQHVAEAAEVAIGTIYRYFANKEALLCELNKFIREDAAAKLFNGWQDSLSAKEKYDLVWENAFHCVLSTPKRLTLIEMLHFVPNMHQTEINLFEDQTFKRLFDFYQQGIDSKRFLDWDLFALFSVSFDTSIALAKQVIRGRYEPNQTELKKVRDASWAIIQNPDFNQQD